jgi:hypothetical protein
VRRAAETMRGNIRCGLRRCAEVHRRNAEEHP